jgi:hypothetical protein
MRGYCECQIPKIPKNPARYTLHIHHYKFYSFARLSFAMEYVGTPGFSFGRIPYFSRYYGQKEA